MLDITALLEELKASPYEEEVVRAPHSGVVAFAEGLEPGNRVYGPAGTWKEKPGSLLATIEREHNPRPLAARQKAEVAAVLREHEGQFVEAGTPLVELRHYLSKDEVLERLLKQALFLFTAPDRAKYYFIPEVDKQVNLSGSQAVTVRDGMELFIMSRMKREAPVTYKGPQGVIYSVYFQANENVDQGQPLIGVCPPDQLPAIQDVVVRVQTEWEEKE